MRILYTLLFYAALPGVLLRLLWKGRRLPGYRKRIGERLGLYGTQSAVTDLWFHAVSVGETEAAIPVVQTLQRNNPNLRILITCTTPTGSNRIQSVFGKTVSHVYLPYDIPGPVQRFLKHFAPKVAIIMETEIWPNLFRLTSKRGIPILIINGRLSSRSVKGYRKLGRFVSDTLDAVTLIAAQTPDDAERYQEVGVSSNRVCVPGNIKFDIQLDSATRALATEIKQKVLNQRPAWIAGSIHPGEDDLLIDAWISAKQTNPDLVLILAPRHPERADDIARNCERRKLFAVRRSRGEVCSTLTDVFILDTIGELKTFYSASAVAFVGGSLIPHGGQNVLEPAAAGIPVFFGPHTANFKDITKGLINRGGAVQITHADEIAPLVIKLLQDSDYRGRLTQSATEFLAENRGAVTRVVALISDQLDRIKV